MGGNDDKGGRRASLGAFLFDEIRSAIQDIRQKLVEEGWFGRVVTPAPVIDMDRSRENERGGLYGDDHRPIAPKDTVILKGRLSFEVLWRPAPPDEQKPEIEKDRGPGIDR